MRPALALGTMRTSGFFDGLFVLDRDPDESARFLQEAVAGGVRLIDAPGAPLFDEVNEGELVTVRGGSLFRNGDCVAVGRTLGANELAGAIAEQRGRVTEALEAFADNTLRYLRDEGRLL